MPTNELGMAVRIRIGAPLVDDAIECARCGGVVDRTGKHCLRCALPEATRGHNAVRNTLLNFVSLADPSASLEATELIPSAPSLRPADIFTVATFASSRAALDVGVCCPDSAGSAEDACDRMWDSKREHYRPHLEEMANLGIHYYPLVLSL